MRRRHTDASEPVRSCIGCRRRRPLSALVRITRSPSGIVVGGSSSGRGAWLCRSNAHGVVVEVSCLDSAITKRSFARAWRSDVTANEHRTIREHTGYPEDQSGPPNE